MASEAGAGKAEEIEVLGTSVRLSSPDKVYFPRLGAAGGTKRHLFEYYRAVAAGAGGAGSNGAGAGGPFLDVLRNRPVYLQRFPDGIEGEEVYQKRVPHRRPEHVESCRVTFPSGRTADALKVTMAADICWASNLGAVTFHPLPVRCPDTDRPDELRIDLDPQPGTGFEEARRVALDVLAPLLDELGLTGYPKTSGGRGIHVFVPIEPTREFTIVRRGVIALARELERRAPDAVTSKWWKEERGERIFIDYNQAARDRTMAAAYSARRTPIATVSTPVTWAELADVHPDDCTIATVPGLLARRGDPMAGMHEDPGSLGALLELADRDEAAGLGEMPYPPNYPKMPGEPPRVPPSKARDQAGDSPVRHRLLAPPPPESGLAPIYGSGDPGLLELLRTFHNPLAMITRRRAEFGDISYVNAFGLKFVTPLTADGAEAIAMNRDQALANEPAWGFLIGPFFRRGILLMDFEEHHHHRRILQQAFTAPRLRDYLGAMQPLIRERVAALPTGEGVRLLVEFKKLTLDVALEVFLGLRLPPAEADRVNHAFIACVDAGMSLIRKDLPGSKWARGLAGRRVLEEFFHRRLPAKRARRTPDLFSVLCHVEHEGQAFTDEDVVNHMIFMLMAAHDTTTITLTTMAYYLARHPEWQDRARAQSLSLAPALDYDALGGLTVLDAVMREALRLNSPVPGLARQAMRDTQICGSFVPKGAYVTATPMASHYDPSLWTRPERFDPDRFSPGRAEDKRHRFAWMPFGGGVHKCIGMYFAQLEIKTVMHQLLRGHSWSTPAGYRWKLDNTTLPVPRDRLPVTLRAR